VRGPHPRGARGSQALRDADNRLGRGLQHVSTVKTLPGDWTAYYRTLADHLLEGKDLPVKPEQVREAMAVFDAAKKSAKTGETVKL